MLFFFIISTFFKGYTKRQNYYLDYYAKNQHYLAVNNLTKTAPEVLKTDSYFSAPSFPLAVIPWKQRNYRIHTHQFTELVVITGGSGIHCAGAADYPVSRGDVFVINSRQAHGYRNARNLTLVNILFDMPALGVSLRDLENVPGYNALFKLEPAEIPGLFFPCRN